MSLDRSYTSRLQKGGALVDEMRELIRVWDGDRSSLASAIEANLLGRPTRARMRDVVFRTFIPRFVDSEPPDLWRSLAVFERAGWGAEQLLPIHFYAAAASEPLMWDFVTDWLFEDFENGQKEVDIAEVLRFLDEAPATRFARGQKWSPKVSLKVAQGLLAALRDFGLLEGRARKRIASLYVPTPTFAFIALIRASLGNSGTRLLEDEAWRLFLFSTTTVERSFIEAQQMELLRYDAAGSVVRIEFPTNDFEEYAHVLSR